MPTPKSWWEVAEPQPSGEERRDQPLAIGWRFDTRGLRLGTAAVDSRFVHSVYRRQTGDVERFLSVATIYRAAVVTRQLGRTRLTLRGPETRASSIDCPPDAELVGILFTPGTYMPNLAARLLVDAALDVPSASNGSCWFHCSAWEFPTFGNADTFVARLARGPARLRSGCGRRAARATPLDVAPLGAAAFAHATGLSHTRVRQIQRAQAAAHLLKEGRPILDVVHEAGYFDQAHLTRSLRRFIGQTPGQLQQAPQPTSLY